MKKAKIRKERGEFHPPSYLVYSAPGTAHPVKEILVGRTPYIREAERWAKQFKGRIIEE